MTMRLSSSVKVSASSSLGSIVALPDFRLGGSELDHDATDIFRAHERDEQANDPAQRHGDPRQVGSARREQFDQPAEKPDQHEHDDRLNHRAKRPAGVGIVEAHAASPLSNLAAAASSRSS